jgi:quercetin dioxygenase-like cupin family protein
MAHAGEVLENPVTGERIEFRLTAEDSAGELLEFDDFWSSPSHRTPEHVHPEMEECWQVIAGEVGFRIGGAERAGAPGAIVVAAAGIPHSAWNACAGGVHLRIQMRPALRWEDFIARLFALARAGQTDERGTPEPRLLADLLREFRREVALPPARSR